jgi:hypothetical protein
MTARRQVWYNVGRDARRLPSQRARMYVSGDYAGPQSSPVTLLIPNYTTGVSAEPIQVWVRPYVISDPPFDTSSYPAGTLFFVGGFTNYPMFAWTFRVPGTTSNPLTKTLSYTVNRNEYLIYMAYGMPAGAYVHIDGYSQPSNTQVINLTINAGDVSSPFLIYELAPFMLPSSDNGEVAITTTWYNGQPTMEGFNESWTMQEYSAQPVPSSLPAGYTSNPDTTNRRNGVFGYRSCGDPRRLRAGPCTTYETMGLGGDESFGFAPFGSNVWFNNALWNYPVSPSQTVPLAFTCAGPGNVAAPGGIDQTQLSSPLNNQPLTRLAAGLTTTTLSSAGNLAFIPTTDGWYQVKQDGTALAGVGEYEFGWKYKRTASRGRTGRSFYAPCPFPLSPSTLVLTPYATPVPTAIASGGTTISLALNIYAAWASVSLPSAGNWRINVAAGTIASCGMEVGYSLSDPSVVNPDGTLTWEPYLEVNTNAVSGVTFHGFASSPPAAPHSYDSWIVGANPSGAWVGHINHVAIWDSYVSAWQFSIPVAGSVIPTNAAYWFDGTNWHSNGTDPQLSFVITTTGPQIVYLCLEPFDKVQAITGSATISWAAA